MSTDPFADLPDRDRSPRSARILDGWVRDAQKIVGSRGERVGWILASTIVAAALQRELQDETPVFLLKGGVFIERMLGLNARATKDVDTLYRGSEEELDEHIDQALSQPWGEITFGRSEIQVIEKARRTTKPRRFQVFLDIRGNRWRRIQVEISFAEGASADSFETVVAPATGFFGIAAPEDLVTISLAYQIAHKLHASTDPDAPPEFVNDRVRDIVDLTLLREAFYPNGADLSELRGAAEDVFAARALEAEELGLVPRVWPPVVKANEVWRNTWHIPAGQVDLHASLEDAINAINEWIEAIAHA